jgi:hypothetical protein
MVFHIIENIQICLFQTRVRPKEEIMMCKICNFGGQVIGSSPSTELDMTKNFTSPFLGAERVAAVLVKGRTILLQHQ